MKIECWHQLTGIVYQHGHSRQFSYSVATFVITSVAVAKVDTERSKNTLLRHSKRSRLGASLPETSVSAVKFQRPIVRFHMFERSNVSHLAATASSDIS